MVLFFDLETNGLSPIEENKSTKERYFRKIISLSWVIDDGEVNCVCGDIECSMIEKFHEALKEDRKKNGQAIVCGFNVDFDITFLRVRTLANRMRIDDDFEVMDLRTCINPEKYALGTMRNYCDMMGIPVLTENGARMLQLYAEKNWNEIRKHNEEDVVNTRLLHSMLNAAGFLNQWRKQNEL